MADRPAAGLALIELGALGYEFTNRLDQENAMARDEGLKLYAAASLALGKAEEAVVTLRELEATDGYGLDVREAIALIASISGKTAGAG